MWTEKMGIKEGWRQRLEWCSHKARNAWNYWKWERDKEGSSPRGIVCVCMCGGGGVLSCQHLDFGLLASRTVREYISVVLSHPVCGNLLWQSWETKAAGYIDSNWFSKNMRGKYFLLPCLLHLVFAGCSRQCWCSTQRPSEDPDLYLLPPLPFSVCFLHILIYLFIFSFGCAGSSLLHQGFP